MTKRESCVWAKPITANWSLCRYPMPLCVIKKDRYCTDRTCDDCPCYEPKEEGE